MTQPLPYLEITEMIDGEEPKLHQIPLNQITETGVTVGRAGNIRIAEGTGREVTENVSRRQATLYKIQNSERNAPDYYLRCGYRDNDGQWTYSGATDTPPKMRGTGVWLGSGPISPDYALQLRPGTFVKIVPKIANYQCILQWVVHKNGSPEPPTVPMDEDALNRLQFENRTLKEQSAVKDIQITKLRELADQQRQFVRQQKDLAEQMQLQTEQLSLQIKRERDINKTQDKKIGKIKLLGAVCVVAVLISLGIPIEQLEKLFQIVAVLAGGGMIWASAENQVQS